MKLRMFFWPLAPALLLAACSLPTPTLAVQPTRTGYPAPGTALPPQGYPGLETVVGYPAPATSAGQPPATPPAVPPADTATPAPPPADTAAAPTDTPAPGATSGPVVIVYKNFEIVPAQTTLKAGTTVVFLIQDGLHEPYSSDANFDAGANLGDGASYPFTFAQAGTFTILCGYHDNMKGTVVVTP